MLDLYIVDSVTVGLTISSYCKVIPLFSLFKFYLHSIPNMENCCTERTSRAEIFPESHNDKQLLGFVENKV